MINLVRERAHTLNKVVLLEEAKVFSNNHHNRLLVVSQGLGLHKVNRVVVEDMEDVVEVNVVVEWLHKVNMLDPMSTKAGDLSNNHEVGRHLSSAVAGAVAKVLGLLMGL